MNPEPPANPMPAADPNPPLPEAVKPAKRRHIPHLIGWLLAIFLSVVLVGLILPTTNHVGRMGSQTKALAQSKQIGLALKLFAGDHDGNYPQQGVPAEMNQAPSTSNEAFACLFPTYTQYESMFGNELSAYQTGVVFTSLLLVVERRGCSR